MTEELIPDGTADEFDVFATDQQREMRGKLERMTWKLSHLWEYEQGSIAAWFIARNPNGKGYTQCYVKPDGEMVRYVDKVRLSGRRASED